LRIGAPQSSGMLDRVLALPPLDRALSQLLGHPRALQRASILVGIVMVGLALRPLIWPAVFPSSPVSSTAMPPLPAPALPAPAALQPEHVEGQPAAATGEDDV